MADTNDTIDGLLAEFRGYAAGMPPSYHVTMSWHDFRVMLDRFEAAHRRERGDAAKLRDALVQAELFVGNIVRHRHQTLVPGDKCTACDGAEELRDMICAALAAPATAEKSSAVGDAAKLREALKLCVDEMCNRCHESAAARGNPLPCLSGCEPVRKAKAALAEPARNCDIVPIEAPKASDMFHRERPLHGYDYETHDWLLAPATEKEGGSDGNE